MLPRSRRKSRKDQTCLFMTFYYYLCSPFSLVGGREGVYLVFMSITRHSTVPHHPSAALTMCYDSFWILHLAYISFSNSRKPPPEHLTQPWKWSELAPPSDIHSPFMKMPTATCISAFSLKHPLIKHEHAACWYPEPMPYASTCSMKFGHISKR